MNHRRTLAPTALAALAVLAWSQPASGQRALAFTHVSVIDGADSIPRPDQTVVIRGNRITMVAPSRSVRVPAGSRIVSGRGKYLLPGFWDMHVHTAIIGGRELLALYVANGVTGVRDMAGDWSTIAAWRDEISRGRLVGPRIVASGPYLEGGDVPIPHILTRSPDEGRAGVDSLVRLGVDFVKVHGQLTRDTYFAIARRARERGIAFAGHVPRAVGAADASDSGQRSIEHLLAIPAPCTPAESLALQPRFSVQGALGRCSSQDLAPLYARFVRNETWVTPTDAPLRNSPPGFGVHEELVLLARGGLSPYDIIRAATWEPARYFGMLDSAGTIATGRFADLVLLDANPLRDIGNTRRIAAVVSNGQLYDANDRKRLLRSAMQPHP